MNRGDLKKLSVVRLREARVLYKARCYSGAYYLAGYTVECAIKACIAKRTRQYEFPDKELAIAAYQHSAEKLIKVAQLSTQLVAQLQSDQVFAKYWSAVKLWSESDRYNSSITQVRANDLITAIEDPAHGVLQWLKNYW